MAARLVVATIAILVGATGCSRKHEAANEPSSEAGSDAAARPTLALPSGFQPEGITKGPGTTAYVGTVTRGGIVQIDLATGASHFVVPPPPVGERVIIGVTYDADHQKIIACGGWNANGFVFDAATGEKLATIQFPAGSMINDVRVMAGVAFFTDSRRQVFYRVAMTPTMLPAGTAQEIALVGDFASIPGLYELNSNGIAILPGGESLLIVNSSTGGLFNVAATTGVARKLDVSVPNGDGLILDGDRLIVIQNYPQSRVSIVRLDATFLHGTVERTLESPYFASPSTGIQVDGKLWIVNSRLADIFHGATDPTDKFELVSVDVGP